MAANNNIFSNEWCDLVFESKNKAYGAYEHRRNSDKRHFRALVIASVLFILGIIGPGVLESIIPEERVADETVRTLSQIELEKPKEENIIKELPPPPPVRNTIKFTPPVIKPDEMVNEEDEPKMQVEVQKETAAVGAVDFDKGTDDIAAPIAETNKKIVEEEEKPFVKVEQMPEFPGGAAEMQKFIQKNLKYPVIAQEMGISGMVIVQFVVGKDGKIGNIKVMRGLGSGCDEEAIRVVEKMPAWRPGRQGGQPVLVYFTLPFRFVLNK